MSRLLSPPTNHWLPNRLHSACELGIASLVLLVLGCLLPSLMATGANWGLAYATYALISLCVMVFWSHGTLGWANRVTLFRGVLIALVAGALANDAFIDAIWLWLIVATIALLLDGVDGWIARRTQSFTPFGARFDMELDALLILLLCIGLIQEEALGLWVLLIGVMRYLFIAASWHFTWLAAPLFASFRRKLVCVWQVSALLLALTPLTHSLFTSLLALSALLSLAYSFGLDSWWLYKQSRR
ncbi:CDP-alcohol phosphatidyltransferase family protein [Vreelandella populi]|uniref:CDP-alcohol phosphatidyltransferase family protein n=1 Tax=Vreelandella populi TaxID=2498858 RepID=A0A3S0WNE5_9GAMM|nr:CDP-alcohol phosphatidyltransferase family protein [Halomonas populi]RUR46287.1 CDP-alcohol phosphatidyltransferase family protein [Halomonas populi]RUR53215.1 CDP-alcohol phosphatidyltransferase family protein [Halomonas populi]